VKRVALVGSSGGNLYQLGGANPAELIGQIRVQLVAAGIELAAAAFVAASGSLDSAEVRGASLWEVLDGEPYRSREGMLAEVNEAARAADVAIATSIDEGSVEGLILVSADPLDINAASVRAAAARAIPAVGSGGSAVAAAEKAGIRFVTASGTTGSTNATRAITYAAGFAREWGLRSAHDEGPQTVADRVRGLLTRIDPRPILSDCLPAVVPVAVGLALVRYLPPDIGTPLIAPLLACISIVIAAFAAAHVSRIAQAGLIAGVIAGAISSHEGLLSVLGAGLLAGFLGNWIVVRTAMWGWPSTIGSMVASGGAGVIAGLIGVAVGVVSRPIDRAVLDAMDLVLANYGVWVGLVLGLAMWPLIRRGLYHTLIIPLMIIEYEGRGLSFLATADVVALVVAAAGVAAAYALVPRVAEDRRVALHTLRVTFWFGTYVEGIYPFVDADRRVLLIAALAGGAGTAVAGLGQGLGISYVPPWMLPLVGSSIPILVAAVLTSFGVALLAAAALNVAASFTSRRSAAATR
jgi:hypothetical protein